LGREGGGSGRHSREKTSKRHLRTMHNTLHTDSLSQCHATPSTPLGMGRGSRRHTSQAAESCLSPAAYPGPPRRARTYSPFPTRLVGVCVCVCVCVCVVCCVSVCLPVCRLWCARGGGWLPTNPCPFTPLVLSASATAPNVVSTRVKLAMPPAMMISFVSFAVWAARAAPNTSLA